jgi:hypothetical protein
LKSASTDTSGKYIIPGMIAGAFQGTVSKDGYQNYPFSGTLVAGETLTRDVALDPILPVISNITVSGITMNSAIITWMTDQPADSFVDYGTTSSYGSWVKDQSLVTDHSLPINNLAVGTTYHFKVTSTNAFGMAVSSVDSTLTTQAGLLTLGITSPVNGATVNRLDVLLKGTVVNARGNETGVTVNGKVAMVVGNEFFANHVPLQEGSNTIEAVATATEGNTVNTSIAVNAIAGGETLTLTANVESGIAPLEVLLTITSSLDLANASLSYTGPGEVEFLSRSQDEYRVNITVRGIYYFTVRVNSGDAVYEDSIGIAVLAPEELDNLLKSKWEGMKGKLAAKDIEGSLSFFTERKRGVYRNIFTTVAAKLLLILQEMGDIQLIEHTGMQRFMICGRCGMGLNTRFSCFS